jgi:hypothetical protein
MGPSAVSGALAAACVALLTLSGTLYVLMGLAVRRRGIPIQLLSVSFDPRVRIAIVKRVTGEYKRLCGERHQSPLLYVLLWVSVALAMGCAAASFLVLAVAK